MDQLYGHCMAIVLHLVGKRTMHHDELIFAAAMEGLRETVKFIGMKSALPSMTRPVILSPP